MMPRSLTKQKAWKTIKCISFMLVFTLILSTLSPMFLPKSNGMNINVKNRLARGFYGEPQNSLDVIAVGNSNIECGFSPMELWKRYGITGYTCGEPCQTIFDAYNLLSEVMTCQKPKVVILDVDGIFPLNNGVDSYYKLLNSTLNRFFPVIQYHDFWKTIHPGNTVQSATYLWASPTRGYLYSGMALPFSGRRLPKKSGLATDRIDTAILAQLNAFQILCRENGAQLVLVYIPTAFSWDLERHYLIADYAATNDLPFVDLNMASNDSHINWNKDTRDGGIHLNYSGAKRVTLYLGAYLQRHFVLPDHRKDMSFDRWNTAYEKYLRMVKPTAHL